MIDCDVHNDWKSADELLPYLEPTFRDYLERGELPGPRGSFPHAHRPWVHPEGFNRQDAVPADGGAGSDYELMRDQLIDRYKLDYAILTGDAVIDASTLANTHYACALASAYNDWQIENWLSLDPRLKGSLFVVPSDPHAAAEEVRRVGAHPDMVQVYLATGSQRPFGDRFYLPLWEAAAELNLPVAIHPGAQGGVNARPWCGPPTFFWEMHALLCETGMGHMASVIAQGIFERFPGMRLVLVECGVSWIPPILWRLDTDYKALRKETPWLKKLPSEYAREHIRVTTQPLETPHNTDNMWPALADIGAEDMLMFSSDYPHWDFDDPNMLPIPDEWREKVFDKNARELYGLPSPEDAESSDTRHSAAH
jgi:predicted TIM-barrel fold metal-dependent hydrolase